MTRRIDDLPSSWMNTELGTIIELNPKVDKSQISDELEVIFVPMTAVEAETGHIDVSGARPFSAVKKGFTPFRQGDILFAKITPCMENGKMAVVPEMRSEYGFGSTEFHVLRPEAGIDASWLYYFASSSAFRGEAEHNMTGAVGQKRVPGPYLAKCLVPIPPTAEQRRVIAKIEALFSELDKGIESLETARKQLKVYRQAVLKQAFEGKLTAQWRVENPDAVLSAEDLLSRLRAQRKQSHDDATLAWKRNFEDWQSKNNGQSKPKKPAKPIAIDPIENGEFPVLPKDWLVLRFGALCASIRNGISKKPEGAAGSKILRISAVRPMECALDDIRLIDNEDGIFGDYFLNAGDLLFTRYNGSRAYVGVGALYRGNGDHLFPDKLIQARLAVPIIRPDYLEMAVNCSISREHIEKRIRTTAGQSGVSGSDIKSIPVPVCSPAEQDLIVEKVQSVWQESGRLLVEINHAIQQSEALRQSILKKAFSGQLVPQDPNDEPASALLARIKAEKAARAKPDKRSRKTAA